MEGSDTERDNRLGHYQWLPTRKELNRSKYMQKGNNGFQHPYLPDGDDDTLPMDYPMGETGLDERIFTATIGATGRTSRNEPLEMAELKLRTRMRDEFKCVRCEATENRRVQNREGTKSHPLVDLETLCQKCHHAEHGYRQN